MTDLPLRIARTIVDVDPVLDQANITCEAIGGARDGKRRSFTLSGDDPVLGRLLDALGDCMDAAEREADA